MIRAKMSDRAGRPTLRPTDDGRDARLLSTWADGEARAILAETEREPEYGGHGFIAYSNTTGAASDINAHSAWCALAESLSAFVQS